MALIVWTEQLSVGIDEFDKQHKKLIQLINQLHDAMRVGSGKDVLDRILGELLEYTKTHFAAEEKFLSARGYGELSAHVAEHQKLTKKVADFQEEFKTRKITMTLPVMNFLKDWLSHHILEVDKLYSTLK